jgi:dipeptidyl aminopeptidase/acylaminoacyl peptidase
MKRIILFVLSLSVSFLYSQNKMSPDMLWELGRVGLEDVSDDGEEVLYGVSYYDTDANSSTRELYMVDTEDDERKQLTNFGKRVYSASFLKDDDMIGFVMGGQYYTMDLESGELVKKTNIEGGISNVKAYPFDDQIMLVFSKEFKTMESLSDQYPDLPKAEAMITDDLMYRHWDTWSDDKSQHVCFTRLPWVNGKTEVMDFTDIMKGEAFDSPMLPFGGSEEFELSPDGEQIAYVCKKLSGKEYALSTNSEIYLYTIANAKTTNITEGMMGYDKNPSWSPDGKYFSWTSMPRDGYESDVNSLWIMDLESKEKLKLTENEHISGYSWADDDKIYIGLPKDGTQQIHEIEFRWKPGKSKRISTGTTLDSRHNYTGFVPAGKNLVVTRQDMNHATEIFMYDGKDLMPVSKVNDALYAKIDSSHVEKRMIKTTDGKDMLTWVIYPPNFDPSKKYPTLLYCQGGPQSQVSQFYSFRWNFQLMAAQGYIVVAPNRRGLPGFGPEWNEQISKDWGGQAMKDYLSAIDAVSEEPFVDKEKRGAVGASYGGYSVYMLAGIHEGRFNALISHCGLFNLKSWYGSTEEMFFANWDLGGSYWDPKNDNTYKLFDPSNYVQNWTAPILVIHGGLDFRVPINQGMEAFQAAQLRDVPSRFLYFPNEGHWVLSPQNGLVWHSEFFGWLDKWLK